VKKVSIQRPPRRCIARALFAHQGAILSLNHWRVFSKDPSAWLPAPASSLVHEAHRFGHF